jgi:hypothetical protein
MREPDSKACGSEENNEAIAHQTALSFLNDVDGMMIGGGPIS